MKMILCSDPFEWNSPRTWLDWAIRKISSSRFNHGASLIIDCDKIVYIDDATGAGVHMTPLTKYIEKYPNRKYYTCDIENVGDQVLAKSLLGDKYQFSIFWTMLLFCTAKRIFGVNSKITRWCSTEDVENKYYCFEYVGTVFNLKDPWLLTGKELDQMFSFYEVNIKTFVGNESYS